MTLLCTVYFYSRMSKLVKTGQMRCPISPSAIPETLSGGREPTLESRSLTSPSAVWHACTFTHPTHHNQNSNVQSQYHKLGRKSGIPWNSIGPWGSSYRNSGAKIRFSVLQNQPVFLWILSQCFITFMSVCFETGVPVWLRLPLNLRYSFLSLPVLGCQDLSPHYQCRHPIPCLLDTTFFLFLFLETGAHCVILTGLEPSKSCPVCIPGSRIQVMCRGVWQRVICTWCLSQKVIYKCLVLNMKYFDNTLAYLFIHIFHFMYIRGNIW